MIKSQLDVKCVFFFFVFLKSSHRILAISKLLLESSSSIGWPCLIVQRHLKHLVFFSQFLLRLALI